MSPLQAETKRILMEQARMVERYAHALAMGERGTWIPLDARRIADLAEAQALANLETRRKP